MVTDRSVIKHLIDGVDSIQLINALEEQLALWHLTNIESKCHIHTSK